MKFKKILKANHEKISIDSKKKFLTYRKMDINLFKYEALKKHIGTYIEFTKKITKKIFNKY